MTVKKKNIQQEAQITALYCRLSVDDDRAEESNSITIKSSFLRTMPGGTVTKTRSSS